MWLGSIRPTAERGDEAKIEFGLLIAYLLFSGVI